MVIVGGEFDDENDEGREKICESPVCQCLAYPGKYPPKMGKLAEPMIWR